MSVELKKQHEHIDVYEMIEHFQMTLEKHANQERNEGSET